MTYLDLYQEPTRQVDLTPDLNIAPHQEELKRLCKMFFRGSLITAECTMRALTLGLAAWQDEERAARG